MGIKENLKTFRKGKKLTQRQLATKSGISFSMISKIESGEQKNPSLETIKSIAKALDTTASELLGDKIQTYSDLFTLLMTILDHLPFSRVVFEENPTSIAPGIIPATKAAGIVFNDNICRSFLTEWENMRSLYEERSIDEDVYSAWIEKTILKYDRPIDFEYFTYRQIVELTDLE